MVLSNSRRQFVFSGLGTLIGCISTGCGTIMHPERKGQPAGNLDWSIVALDGVGLLLFLVPGVIAFAVDFNNGSIYLPAEEKSQAAIPVPRRRKLISVMTQPRRLTHGAVEHAVAQHSGRQFRLVRGQYETFPLDNLDQFW
ncbi:MAG: hypothetical protein JWM11_6404, partial [Planctomycetaceae bacterium]|nr:hypothetical protein [Planctomycetaceae bacterium]